MDRITSRQNPIIRQLRALGRERSARAEAGVFVCDGEKLLREALQCGAEVQTVLWADTPTMDLPHDVKQYTAPAELVAYVSALSKSPGPVFTVAMRKPVFPNRLYHVIVLDSVQDPGNVGTVLRTANAFGIDAVLLVGACADLYSPKTVRATMGAIFRTVALELSIDELQEILRENDLALFGAALTETAQDLRKVSLKRAAVAIGSEGRGLRQEVLRICDSETIIPMRPEAESLNAAVAASIVMWEMARSGEEVG